MAAFVFIFIVILLVIVMLAVRVARGRRLSGASERELRRAFASASAQTDVHRRVLDAEKVLHQAFEALGYTGTFADKLRKAGPRMGNIDAIWDAHRLRNRIAHDVHVQLSADEANRAVRIFGKALDELC